MDDNKWHEKMVRMIRSYEGIPLDAPEEPLSEEQKKQVELFLQELARRQKIREINGTICAYREIPKQKFH